MDGNDAKLKSILLGLVPQGDTIGNVSLKAKFLDELRKERMSVNNESGQDLFWKLRDELVDEGHLKLGRGKGGSVSRIQQSFEEELDNDTESSDLSQKNGSGEFALYEPFKKYLEAQRDNLRFEPNQFIICDTARQGSKRTGAWARPDLVVFSKKTYNFIKNAFFEIVTYEIKPAGEDSIKWVYEAAAHQRFSNRSFLAFNSSPSKISGFDEISSECIRLGVGLILFSNPDDPSTYDEYIDARYRTPQPDRVDTFIRQQLQSYHERITKLVHH